MNRCNTTTPPPLISYQQPNSSRGPKATSFNLQLFLRIRSFQLVEHITILKTIKARNGLNNAGRRFFILNIITDVIIWHSNCENVFFFIRQRSLKFVCFFTCLIMVFHPTREILLIWKSHNLQ